MPADRSLERRDTSYDLCYIYYTTKAYFELKFSTRPLRMFGPNSLLNSFRHILAALDASALSHD